MGGRAGQGAKPSCPRGGREGAGEYRESERSARFRPAGNRIPLVLATWTTALAELRRLAAGRLTLAAAGWLAVGLSASAFVVWGFAGITEEVVEGESRAFDRAVLLWIDANVPGWLDGPMRAATALGYYSVVLPLLAVISWPSTSGAGGSRP